MFLIDDLPAKRMPKPHGDFPRKEQLAHLPAADGSRGLAFLVIFYLLAMLGGIVLLGQLTAPTAPGSSASAAARI